MTQATATQRAKEIWAQRLTTELRENGMLGKNETITIEDINGWMKRERELAAAQEAKK